MSLTVAEKNHWKERIAKRIERAIQELLAEHDPTFMVKIDQQARARTIDSLGIAESCRRLDEIKAAIKAIEAERAQISERINQSLIPSSEYTQSYYDGSSRMERVIKERQGIYEKELLNESPLGKKLLTLKREQEELLDTVWLATSSVQIKNLWNQVNKLLGQAMTDLQSRAVQIEPSLVDATE